MASYQWPVAGVAGGTSNLAGTSGMADGIGGMGGGGGWRSVWQGFRVVHVQGVADGDWSGLD